MIKDCTADVSSKHLLSTYYMPCLCNLLNYPMKYVLLLSPYHRGPKLTHSHSVFKLYCLVAGRVVGFPLPPACWQVQWGGAEEPSVTSALWTQPAR